MSPGDKIYTWRSLANPFQDGVPFEIVWRWSDWIHARRHLNEPQYSKIISQAFPPGVVTELQNLLAAKTADLARPALNRLAEVLRCDLHNELAAPRVLTCVTMPDNRQSLLFVGASGLRFITSTSRSEQKHVYFNNLYFGRWLSNESRTRRFRGTVTEQHIAIKELVGKYTRWKFILPDPANGHYRVTRDEKWDEHIDFHQAVQWGFQDDQPGCDWIGFSRMPRPSGDPVKLDAPPEPPDLKDDEP